ncbi:MAG: glycosyltransferase family 1 protein [Caulobacteraceae bacterium]
MTIYFDLSTSARWSGHAVGIVRVERELARWAYAHLGDKVEFCVYDKGANVFHKLNRQVTPAILEGECSIMLDTPKQVRAPRSLAAARKWAREQVMQQVELYRLLQRLRGRRFTREDILNIRRREAAGVAFNDPVTRLTLGETTTGALALGPGDVVISGGLDWEYKDLRSIYQLKAERGFKYAAVIYDLIPLIYPQFVVPTYIDLLHDYFGEMLWVCDYAMCISQCTERDFLNHCAVNHVPAPRSTYFPLGSSLPADIEEEPVFPAELEGMRYCLFVSTLEPRKNHRVVCQAWERLLRSGVLDPKRFRMVFVGRPGWAIGDLLHEISYNPWTKDTVVRLEGVSDALLAELYRRADFSLFPSFYEGYGLPLAEALAHGRPCLSSDRGSLPEVGGDLVRYVDPEDAPAWAEAMGELFTDPDLLRSQTARIAREHRPVTWSDAAEAFFQRLDGVMGEARA